MAIKLSKYCNIPPTAGIYKVYYIDMDDTQDGIPMPGKDGTALNNIVTNNGDWNILPIQLLTRIGRSQPRDTPHGIFYENSIRGVIFTMSAQLNMHLHNMMHKRYALKFVNKYNDEVFIIGDELYPLRMTYTFDTSHPDGSSSYTITYSNRTIYPIQKLSGTGPESVPREGEEEEEQEPGKEQD